jgi:hypothetical protein
MKNIHSLTLLLTLCSSLASYAYEFSFYNNTENPVGIAIQYTGNDTKEPLYKQLVKPKSMVTFSPDNMDIPTIKWGFCLDNIYYIENPTQEQKNRNFEKAPWRKIPVTWVQEKSITKKKLAPKKTDPKKKNIHSQTKTSTDRPTTATPAEKSLCRDRHFDIIRDAQNKIAITSSLIE